MSVEAVSGDYQSQSVEAMYTVHFGDVAVPGKLVNGGVLMFETGKLFGGDSGYLYTGTFKRIGSNIKAELTITKHNPYWGNAFGDAATKFNISVDAVISGSDIVGYMVREGMPLNKLPLKLQRIAELP